MIFQRIFKNRYRTQLEQRGLFLLRFFCVWFCCFEVFKIELYSDPLSDQKTQRKTGTPRGIPLTIIGLRLGLSRGSSQKTKKQNGVCPPLTSLPLSRPRARRLSCLYTATPPSTHTVAPRRTCAPRRMTRGDSPSRQSSFRVRAHA